MDPSIEKKTILVADDERVNRTLLKKIFSADYRVLEAENGLRVLELLRGGAEVTAVVLDLHMPQLDGFGVLEQMRKEPMLSRIPVVVNTASDDAESLDRALALGAIDVITKPFNPQTVLRRIKNLIALVASAHLAEENKWLSELVRVTQIDDKTGLYNRATFCRKTAQIIAAEPGGRHVLVRWDIDNFRVFNDVCGVAEGDRLLLEIGRCLLTNKDALAHDGMRLYGHWDADHFVALCDGEHLIPNRLYQFIANQLCAIFPDFRFNVRLGLYAVDDPAIGVEVMCDRALMALRSAKSTYDRHAAWYDKSMRNAMIEEQHILSRMQGALARGEFVPYFQPQYNYDTGALSGAETLVRWQDPERGLIGPDRFIPLFEKNGFVFELDRFIWRQACACIRNWLDEGLAVPSVSVNVSRHDLYHPQLIEIFRSLIREYALEPSMLHLEITESAYMDDPDQLLRSVSELQSAGFPVEMDDFGSGYSSLNTLKDVPVDVLKLDMAFVAQGATNRSRGGNILSSIIRLAHAINLPVIAEGVETKRQADYLKSIGCLRMQGYFFARPMPAPAFEALLRGKPAVCSDSDRFESSFDGAADFLDATTQSTLLFNSFVGGAAIIEYAKTGQVSAVRLNDPFFETLGVTRERFLSRPDNLLERLTPQTRGAYLEMLETAVRTGEEASCESCLLPFDGDGEPVYVHNRVRCLSRKADVWLLYLSIENITQRERYARANEMFRNVILNIPVGVAVCRFGDRLSPTYVSDVTCRMFGLARAEYDACSASGAECCLAPLENACTPELRARLRAGERVVLPRLSASKRDGSRFWLRVIMRGAFDADGTPLLYASLADITAEIAAEGTIAGQRKEFSAIASSIPGGIFRYAAEGDDTFTYISQSMLSMLGYTLEEFQQKFDNRFSNMVWHEDRAQALAKIDSDIAATTCSDTCEYRIETKSGALKWVYDAGRLITDETGRKWFIVVIVDIDERKRLEEAQLRDKAEIENLINAIPGGVATYEARPGGLRLAFASAGVSAMSGQTPEEYRRSVNAGGFGHVYPPDRERLERAIRSALDQGLEADVNYRVFHSAGHLVWLNLRGWRMGEQNGYPLLYAVFFNLSPQTELYQQIVNETDDVLIVADADTHELLMVNDAGARYAGLPKETAMGMTCYQYLKHRDTPCSGCPIRDTACLFAVHETDDNGRHFHHRYKRIRWNGRDAFINYAADRTDSWSAQKRLDDLIRHVPGGLAVFCATPDGRIERTYLSDGAFKALGYESGEHPHRDISAALERVHPDDRPALRQALHEAVCTHQPLDLDMRILPRSGGLHWVNLNANPVVDEDGTFHFYGVYSDVTKRKALEENLRVAQAECLAMVVQSGRRFYRYLVRGRVLERTAQADCAALAPSGTPELAVEAGHIAPESAQAWLGMFNAIDGGQRGGTVQIRCRQAAGAPFLWHEFQFTLVEDAGGKPVSAILSCRQPADACQSNPRPPIRACS